MGTVIELADRESAIVFRNNDEEQIFLFDESDKADSDRICPANFKAFVITALLNNDELLKLVIDNAYQTLKDRGVTAVQ
jgi:hypothetical protein